MRSHGSPGSIALLRPALCASQLHSNMSLPSLLTMMYSTPRMRICPWYLTIENGEFASWRFHPVKYQRGAFIGPAVPSYELRDWDYDDAGVARMKAGGGVLDDSYQMHLYAPVGTYGDSKVYANIFLWDSEWGTPEFTPDGGTPVPMTRVESSSRYDFADTAFKTFYKTCSERLSADSGYKATTTANPNTLFSAPCSALSGAGTVRVTDRFGNVYSGRISW